MWGVPGVFNIPTWHREYHNHSDSSSSSSPTFHCTSVLSTTVIIPMWGVPGVFNIPTWHREYHNHSSPKPLPSRAHCIVALGTCSASRPGGPSPDRGVTRSRCQASGSRLCRGIACQDSSSSSSPTFHCTSVLPASVIILMWGDPGVFNIPTWHREYHNHSAPKPLPSRACCTVALGMRSASRPGGPSPPDRGVTQSGCQGPGSHLINL